MVDLLSGMKLSSVLTIYGSTSASLCSDTSDSASDRTGMIVQAGSEVSLSGPSSVYTNRKKIKERWYKCPLKDTPHDFSQMALKLRQLGSSHLSKVVFGVFPCFYYFLWCDTLPYPLIPGSRRLS